MLHKVSRLVITKPHNKWLNRSFSSYWQRIQQTININGIFGTNKSHDTINQQETSHDFTFDLDVNLTTPYDISNLAQEYYLNNELEKANTLYINALSTKQNNGDLNFYYAHFLMHCQQDFELSLKYAHKTIECNDVSPPLASPYILLAQLYGLINELELAEKYLNIAVNEIGDDNCNAYFNYAQTLNILKNYQGCIDFLNYALEYLDENNIHHPTKNEINILMNACYIELKDYENAIKFTKKLKDTNIYDNLRIIYEWLNNSNKYDTENQKRFYLTDLNENENDYFSNIFYAKYLISKKDRVIEAFKYLDKAKEIDGEHYTSYYYRALAMYFDESRINMNEMMDLFKYVIDIEAEEINCYVYLGKLYSEMEEYETALEYLEKGISVNGNSNLLYFNYAITLLKLNRIDEYSDAMNKTMDICREYNAEENEKISVQLFYMKNDIYNVNNIVNTTIEVYKEFGDFYLNDTEKLQYKRAVFYYLCALDEVEVYKDDELQEYLFGSIASCYLNIKNEYENMKRYCLMGLHKYPKSAQLNFLYSQYLFQFAQSYVLALKYLDITMELEPDNLWYYLIKGSIYHNRLYDNQKAVECVNTVLELTDKRDPLHAEAREYLFQFTAVTHTKTN